MLTLGPRSGWLQLAVALAVLALLVQTGGDWLISAAIWTAVIPATTSTTSVVTPATCLALIDMAQGSGLKAQAGTRRPVIGNSMF